MNRLVPHYTKLNKIGFLCCDLQERFSTLVPNFKQCVTVANRFAAATTVFPNSRYVVTEQVPNKLGATVADIKLPQNSIVIPKTDFSMIPSIRDEIKEADLLVLFGIEAHVCVLQTVGEVLEQYPDKMLVLAVDGVASTNSYDEKAAFKYFEGMQATANGKFLLLSSESILFQLARSAKDPTFKGISNISKNYPMPR